VPPAYLGKSFAAPHNHCLVSNGAELDSGDVEFALRHVTEHGYNTTTGAQLLLFVNPAQAEEISKLACW
jgi:hypothetical protein